MPVNIENTKSIIYNQSDHSKSAVTRVIFARVLGQVNILVNRVMLLTLHIRQAMLCTQIMPFTYKYSYSITIVYLYARNANTNS